MGYGVITGFSGLFGRRLHRLPSSMAAAMLAGVLLRFGLDLFVSLQRDPLLVGTMLLGYLLCKSRWPRYTMLIVMLLGIGLA